LCARIVGTFFVSLRTPAVFVSIEFLGILTMVLLLTLCDLCNELSSSRVVNNLRKYDTPRGTRCILGYIWQTQVVELLSLMWCTISNPERLSLPEDITFLTLIQTLTKWISIHLNLAVGQTTE
jgi:hypothetical protein